MEGRKDGWMRCADSGMTQDAGLLLYHFTLSLPRPSAQISSTLQLGLLKVLSTWLPRKALGASRGFQKAQLTGARCDCTYTRGVQMSLIFHVPCVSRGAVSLSAQDPEVHSRPGSAEAAEGLFLRPTESPEFLELIE